MSIRIRNERKRHRAKASLLDWASGMFLVVGLLALGVCAYWCAEAALYQASASRSFAHRAPSARAAGTSQTARPAQPAHPGEAISEIEIPRLGVSAVVVEGVRAKDLRIAAGHVPGTALPGEPGNVGIAGHRDTFFRKLRYIRAGDTIRLTTRSASYEYAVESTAVVEATDAAELRGSDEPRLTLITCYPFYFAGPAPQRFVVRARQTGVAAAN